MKKVDKIEGVFLLNLFTICLATRKFVKKIQKMVLADELSKRIVS